MESGEVTSKLNTYTRNMNPTPTNHNFYAALAYDKDDDKIIVTRNKSEDQVGPVTVFQAAGIDIPTDMVVTDAGATGNFFCHTPQRRTSALKQPP